MSLVGFANCIDLSSDRHYLFMSKDANGFESNIFYSFYNLYILLIS